MKQIAKIFLILTLITVNTIILVSCGNETDKEEIVSESTEISDSDATHSESVSEDIENIEDIIDEPAESEEPEESKEPVTIDPEAWYNTTPAWKSSSYCGVDYYGYTLYNYYGDVIKSVGYSNVLNRETSWVNTSYYYDEDDQIILLSQEIPDEGETYTTQYEYNEHGDVTKSFDVNGTNSQFMDYEYDDNGNIIKCSIISYIDDYDDAAIYYTVICKWDDQNRIISVETTQNFDEWAELHGRPEPGEEDWITYNLYYEYTEDQTQIERHYMDGIYTSMEICKYNDEGQCIETTSYNIYDGEESISSTIIYNYDERGNLKIKLVKSGSLNDFIEYEYVNEYYD